MFGKSNVTTTNKSAIISETISPEKTIPYECLYFFSTSLDATCFDITRGIPLQRSVVKTHAIDNATV